MRSPDRAYWLHLMVLCAGLGLWSGCTEDSEDEDPDASAPDMGAGGAGGGIIDATVDAEPDAEGMGGMGGVGGVGGMGGAGGMGGMGGAGGEGGEGGAGGCVEERERCDNLDNDCDGNVDEDYALGETCGEGFGACRTEGVTTCGDDGRIRCDAVPGEPSEELCNGIDDDCDLTADEGFELGEPCRVGVGICEADGMTACSEEGVICVGETGPPGEELCNERDDDCDGTIDEDFGAGAPCEAGMGACLREGVTVCADNEAVCNAEPGEPMPELCDGIDNNCDGEVDNVGEQCVSGEGACGVPGIFVCVEGELEPQCNAVPGMEGPEVCNQVDDDCDGEIDEGVPDCQAALRAQLMRCGNSGRDVASFVDPAVADLQVVVGCSPNDNVQAMLVTRGGNPDAASTRAYVQNGGNVISEFSRADEVFNAVFGPAERAVQGRRLGNCRDQINPVVRHNPDDGFWRLLGDFPTTANGQAGCGYDVTAFPGIIRLGGWAAADTSLGYRVLGRGRAWFVEADWQDREAQGAAFANSLRVMRGMIYWRNPPAPPPPPPPPPPGP